ncbi:MAG: DUF2490 domain-containing protein [Bacteroidetes bacterium]|nr:DUF2490 domain-containing protein [Bacteroidota bacterium]
MKIFFPLLCLFFTSRALAQADEKPFANDAQLWENINAEHKLQRNFTARFSHEGRITNNMTRLTYYFEDFGVEYKIPKTHFSFLLDYVYIRKLQQKSMTELWSNRHQYYFAVNYSFKVGPIHVHDRQMLMGQVKDLYTSTNGGVPDWYLRNKVTLRYDLNFYWSAYLAEEYYWHMNTPQPDATPHFNRMRYFAGIYYHLDKRNEFELYYLVEQHTNVNNANHNYVLGLGYGFTL